MFSGRLPPRARLGAALRSLWPKLARDRGQSAEGEQHYSFLREEAAAYAAYYLPVNCLKPALVLEEAHLLGLDPAGQGELRWLDLGTGPGTAFWGAAWWCARRGRNLQFLGWDQSPHFVGIARDLTTGRPFGARAEFAHGKDPLEYIRQFRPTHVSFFNSLAEIYRDEGARLREVQKILRALRDLERKDGQPRFLLLVEPGSRESSRELAALKDQLGEEARVLLPCLDARACGALRDPRDWCHEEAACAFPEWLNELGAEAGLRKEAVLFSYALLRASADSQPARVSADSQPARVSADSQPARVSADSQPARASAGASSPLAGCARIVSQRMERKGQVECRLCVPEGKIPARVQRSKATPAGAQLLEGVRGELWRGLGLGEKGDILAGETIKPLENTVFF